MLPCQCIILTDGLLIHLQSTQDCMVSRGENYVNGKREKKVGQQWNHKKNINTESFNIPIIDVLQYEYWSFMPIYLKLLL